MLKPTPRAETASSQAQGVLTAGLRQMLALEGTQLAATVDPSRLVVKGPLELYTQPAESFLERVSLDSSSTKHSYLFFLCHDDGPANEAKPVGICDLTGEDPNWEFGGVGQSELLNDVDLVGELVDQALRRAEAEDPEIEVFAILLWVPDAYEVLLIDSVGEQPPLAMFDDERPVFRLNLASRVREEEGVVRTTLGAVRSEVADLMARFEATLEEESLDEEI